MTKDQIVEQAVRRFRLVSDTESGQRQREIDDLRFQVPELQWDPVAREQRAGGLVQGTAFPLPARPTLSIPKLDQPIQLVTNQQRNAHLGINIHPLSETANKETAEVIQGLYRKIERDSRADIGRSFAFDRAAKCGRGAYYVDVRYDEWSADPFDLSIFIDRILHQSDVYFDPAAQQPDWSDGKWAFWTRWVPLDEYREEYKGSAIASLSETEWANAFDGVPGWTQGAGNNRAVLIAQYWCRDATETVLILHSNGRVYGPDDKIPAGKILTERKKVEHTVKWHLINGREVIDGGDWLGRYIPLIPVIGRELQPFDSERRWSGIIGPAKDGQRLYNYAASAAVELVALEPRAPFVADPRQIEGYEAHWQQANTRNFPYLPYNATIDGMPEPLPPPQRTQVDSNKMGPTMLLLQQADDFIQSATGIHDPSLGKISKEQRSGKAILALQSQSDAGSNMYLQNLGDISMPYEAKVVLDLIPKVYKRPGRVADIIDGEDQSRSVMFNAPYTLGQDGRPQRLKDQAIPKNAKTYDLTTGVYGVSVTVGKSYQTRLQQGSDEIGQILQAQPELMPLIGATYFRFRDFPGAQEIADILKVVRDKQYPGVAMNKDEQPSADEMRARLAAAEQQMQQMQQMLQQAGMEIQTDQAKQQATIAKAQLDAQVKQQASSEDNAVKLKIAEMDNQTKLAIATLQAGQDEQARKLSLMLELLTAAEARRQDDQDGAHEVGIKAMELEAQERQAQRDVDEAEMQRGHEAGVGAAQSRIQSRESERDRQYESTESERGRQHEATMAERQNQEGDNE